MPISNGLVNDFFGKSPLPKTVNPTDQYTGPSSLMTVPFEQQTDLSRFGPNPYSSPLKQMTSGIESFKPQGFNYTAKDTDTMKLPQYDAIRERLNRGFLQTQQASQENLDRQFAAMGGGPGSGVQLKQTENLAGEVGRARADAMSQVDAQELETRQRLKEAEEGRSFQAGIFNTQQIFDAWKTKTAFSLDINSKLAGMDMQWAEASQESINNKFNREMAKYQADHSSGLLGGGGFLGLGI